MSRQKVDNDMITGLTSSKLTGAMPAIDASALTGVGDGITKSASDPATDTNPSDGVGALWLNTTDSNLFACTDATTDDNVWYNVGGGEGDVAPFHGAGSISGFCSGGSSPNSNVIDKFSFVSDADASDHGDLTAVRDQAACASSGTHGYTAGGSTGGGVTFTNVIDRFTFSSNANAVDVGDMVSAMGYMDGVYSSTHGYSMGGNNTGSGSGHNNIIQKYALSASNNATDSGDLTVSRYNAATQQSETHGYASGGNNPTALNVIDKFSFATDGNATDVGDLTGTHSGGFGHNTATHGYICSNVRSGQVEKFSFASDGNSVDHCLMFAAGNSGASNSSTTHGYCSGGGASAPSVDMIQKYNFSSSSTGTDVGNLTVGRYSPRGTQY